MFRDDRRDVLASTRAALDYLQKLYGMFGDWQLALAAYNWGEGSVQRAIAKNQRAGLPTGYDDLAMPAETRQYIPKLQAIKNIVAAPQHLGVQLPDIANHPYFQQVPITRDIDVTVAAKLANLPVEEFKALNPSANRPVILSSGTPQILLPWDNAATFQNNLDNNPPSRLATWTAWIAPATMAVATAARQVGMNEAEFRAANHIPPGMLVKAGSTLLVPRSATKQTEVTTHVADNAQLSLTPAVILKRTSVAVRKGETVAGLAARYNVNTGKVAEWNAMSVKGVFKKAQQAIIYVAVNALNPSVRIGPTSRPAPVAATPKQAPKQGIKLATKPAAKTTAKEASGSPKRK
jgi:membrane-bound lytic murein transglycosylase D